MLLQPCSREVSNLLRFMTQIVKRVDTSCRHLDWLWAPQTPPPDCLLTKMNRSRKILASNYTRSMKSASLTYLESVQSFFIPFLFLDFCRKDREWQPVAVPLLKLSDAASGIQPLLLVIFPASLTSRPFSHSTVEWQLKILWCENCLLLLSVPADGIVAGRAADQS